MKILYKAEIANKVVLVFFVVNLLRIDLYDVVKERKRYNENNHKKKYT